MAQLLSSKVIIQEEEPRVRTVAGVPTAVAGFVGIAERGPIATPTLVTSFEEYINLFGSYTADSDMTLAVQGFFQNGGTTAWIVRTVHFTDITDAATKISAIGTLNLNTAVGSPSLGTVLGSVTGPFALTPGDTLDVDVDGGGVATATFNATAALETAGNTETYVLSDGMTLLVKIDGEAVAQTITFNTAEFSNIALATAAEVAAVINAEISGASASVSAGAPRITSDLVGTDSGVEITGGTGNGILGFPTAPVAGTGNVADITLVTVAEVKTVVEAAVAGCTVSDEAGQVRITSAGTPGPTSSVQVAASSTADDEMGFDNATHSGDNGAASATLQVDGKTDGTYANNLTVQSAAATSGDTDEFNFFVLDDGLVVESYANLGMVSTADNYAPTIINAASNLIVVTDLASTAADPRPAVGSFGPLAGGDDGLVGLDDNDFLGSEAGPTGMEALNTVQDLTMLLIPGRATSAVHNGMVTYGEVTREMAVFPVLDPPEDHSAQEMVDYVVSTAQLQNLSEFGAIYWPRVQILNPSTAVFGTDANIVVPPSGHIAGAYSRIDSTVAGGVFKAPAGIERGRLLNVLGFETDEATDERKLDLVYPKRINPITTFPGAPIHIDGSRTLKGGGNFPSVPERRGVMFIEQSLKRALAFLKHQPNTEETRNIANSTITSFLITQMQVGAFATNDPATAFFVDTSEALNTPSVIFSGQMKIRIGLATAKPTEFIILSFSQDTRALEEELAS